MPDFLDNQQTENPSEDAKKTAGAAKTTANTAKLGIRLLKLARATNPVGASLLLKDLAGKVPGIGPLVNQVSNLGKKVAAGAALLAAYLLALLLAKLLGIAAGLVAGAVIGLIVGGPVGAVVGAAIGAIIGPQVLSLLSQSAAVAKGVTTISSGIGNAIASTTGSLISSMGGAISSAFGALGGVANFLISGLGSLSLPTAALAIPFGGALSSVAIGSLFITGFVAPAAFMNLEGENAPPPPGQTQYFTLTKTASPPNIPNPTSDNEPQVTFTITLTARNVRLNNVQVLDEMKGGPNGSIAITANSAGGPISPVNCPATLNPGEVCTRQITISVDEKFVNSIISNTVRVITTPEGQTSQTSSVVATVRVGTPVLECPATWPTSSGGNGITQGPQGASSHGRLYPAEQAIDIGVTFVPALATFNGVVADIHPAVNNGYGTYIDISGTCRGTPFRARWAHLSAVSGSLAIGANVSVGQVLGTSGNSGTNTTGPHLHYSFFGLPMIAPNIPTNVSNLSCNDSNACNVNW